MRQMVAGDEGVVTVDDHQIYRRDNLIVLREEIADETVDLVYIDPPFNTSSRRVVTFGRNGQRREFDDRFESLDQYLGWIGPRLEECVRALRPGGVLFLHCDWRTSHYLKLLMDELMGYQNFVNEIVWKRHNAHSDSGQGSRHFGRNAESILFYGKGERATWHPQRIPYRAAYIERVYRYFDEDTGRRYALSDVSGPGGQANRNPVFSFMGVKRAWRYSLQQMTNLFEEGLLVITRAGAVPRAKRYLDEMGGKEIQTIWDDIARLSASERVGYPTQKPIALMERIIGCSTNPGDVVLDPFCGSGTTLVTAERMGRQSIGIDESTEAVKLTTQRLSEQVTRARVLRMRQPRPRLEPVPPGR